jgi:ATP-binding cassette subfamily B protein
MADLILVVRDGRIAERGSHEELVALGGSYAELFSLQASAYR